MVAEKMEKTDGQNFEDVLLAFEQGDPTLYLQLCRELVNIKRWPEETTTLFLQQLFDSVNSLTEQHNMFVGALLNINTTELSESNLSILFDICVHVAVKNIYYISLVVRRLLDHFLIVCDQNDNPSTSAVTIDDNTPEQALTKPKVPEGYLCPNTMLLDAIGRLTHEALSRIVECQPMYTNVHLMTELRSHYPYPKRPSVQYNSFVRHVIKMTDYMPNQIRYRIWDLIVDQILALDVILGKNGEKPASSLPIQTIFAMDDDFNTPKKRPTSSRIQNSGFYMEKLEFAMVEIFTFIQSVENGSFYLYAHPSRQDPYPLLDHLLEAFDSRMLSTHSPTHVPFIWFYMISLKRDYCERFLRFLWKRVTCPEVISSRHSQSALCYMGNLVARANFIDARWAKRCMETWLRWTDAYLTEFDGGQTVDFVTNEAFILEGSPRHGTFYAVCQAIFLVFCFRVKQFMGAHKQSYHEIQGWNLERLCHSSLNPLRFCSQQIVNCFAHICRALQLVYCQHLIERNRRMELYESEMLYKQRPFEIFFPFDPYELTQTAHLIRPLYREYHGLSGTATVVPSNIVTKNRLGELGMVCAHGTDTVADTPSPNDDQQTAFSLDGDDGVGSLTKLTKWNTAALRTHRTSMTNSNNDDDYDFLKMDVDDDLLLTDYGSAPGLKTLEEQLLYEDV